MEISGDLTECENLTVADLIKSVLRGQIETLEHFDGSIVARKIKKRKRPLEFKSEHFEELRFLEDINNSGPFLEVAEVVQAGDVHLVKFRCEKCEEMNIGDWRSPICGKCDFDYADKILKLPENRKHWRLLVGTRRSNGRISKKIVRRLFDFQEGLCAYCGTNLGEIEYHVEHIIPLSFGGTNNSSNLCLACPQCNLTAFRPENCLYYP